MEFFQVWPQSLLMTDDVLNKKIDSVENNLNDTSMLSVQSKTIGIEIKGVLFYNYKRGKQTLVWMLPWSGYISHFCLPDYALSNMEDRLLILGRKSWKINKCRRTAGGRVGATATIASWLCKQVAYMLLARSYKVPGISVKREWIGIGWRPSAIEIPHIF